MKKAYLEGQGTEIKRLRLALHSCLEGTSKLQMRTEVLAYKSYLHQPLIQTQTQTYLTIVNVTC